MRAGAAAEELWEKAFTPGHDKMPDTKKDMDDNSIKRGGVANSHMDCLFPLVQVAQEQGKITPSICSRQALESSASKDLIRESPRSEKQSCASTYGKPH